MIVPFQIDSFDIVTTSGIDAAGRPQEIVTSSGVSARVELGNRITLTKDGQQGVADFTAFLNPDVSIRVGNRIVFNGDTFEVLQVVPQKNDVSVDHLEVIGKLQRRR